MNRRNEKQLLFAVITIGLISVASAQSVTQSTVDSTVTSTTTNDNYNYNIQSGTVTNNNNNVNTSTSTNTNNNNNVSTSTSNNVNTNNNVMSGSVTYNNNNVSTVNSNSVNTNNNVSTSVNTNNNNSVNVNTNNSTATNNNNNNSVSDNRNLNINQSSSTSASTVQTNNVNNNNNVNENYSKVVQEVKSPPPSAIAPAISSYSQDVCISGVSGAVQTQIIGVSAGKSVRDMNCERLKLSKTLYDMGMKVAAVSLMCQDERVFRAMEMAGTPCPYMGKISKEAIEQWNEHPDQRPDAKKSWFETLFGKKNASETVSEARPLG